MSVPPATTLVAAQTGVAIVLRRGDVLAVVDPTGGQVADLALFSAADVLESFSPGRTIDYLERVKLRSGDALYSQRSNELALVVRDDVGVHDILLAPCSESMFARRGELNHASCHANLMASLARFGIGEHAIVATLNVFMDVRLDAEGRVSIHPPPSRAGDRFELRAQRDLIVGITACSSELTNGGRCKPIAYEVIRQSGDDLIGYERAMEGSKYNCRGDGCACQVGAVGDYCDPKCKASNDNGSCQCQHPACPSGSEVKQATREATRGDEKVS